MTSKKGSSSSAAALQNDASHIVQGVWERYVRETPQRVKLLDTFMAFLVALGGIQFLYAVVGGNYVSLTLSFPKISPLPHLPQPTNRPTNTLPPN